ncbi:BglG family transcription antiterminator [Bacillus sp. Marseille-P3800]|uniref:BglG family transcription antiterminator n=1 Tax=Bacillus sp. Marseille-P3800 TaxID=2014782 RepID=UPI000C079E66|nr:BglG family transcription antiterminator [Bacillus sp. Marseille-P3800]
MALNDRSQKILNEIISNRQITSGVIEKKYELSRRQLGYTIQKINEWLGSEDLPEIERTRQGHFIVDQSVFSKLSRQPADASVVTQEQGFLTEEQRSHYLLFMLLANKEELSLFHFQSELGYSKNTILNDLKRVQERLNEFNLDIYYSRRDGYLLQGKELNIRKLLIHLVDLAIHSNQETMWLEEVANIEKDEIEDLQKRIEKVEQRLGIRFTDEKMLAMPYIFLLVLKRIASGSVLEPFPIEYEELSDTKEYQATEYIFQNMNNVPKQERLFITLHLLAANVHWSDLLTEDDSIPDLIPALSNMLRSFEKSACIYLQERELLLKKLVQHTKPAYYRIRYQLTEMETVQNPFSKEYRELHHLVKRSLGPLEELFGKEIPETEAIYLTMLIGSWMTRQGESIDKKIKAIVVCPQGVSVSRLMLKELKELFPEFIFLDSLSVRQFNSYELSYDLIFSQTSLATEKLLYVTKAFLSREEKYRLKQQVMQDIHGYKPTTINIDHLMDMISGYATVENENDLRKALHGYFFPTESNTYADEALQDSLSTFLTKGVMQQLDAVEDWDEALRQASKPLVDQGIVEPRYVDALVANKDRDPYIVIGPGLAIPHAAPEEGVIQTGMSLLQLKEPVHFTEEEQIHVIIVIAAKDKHQHIRALRQLIKLAGSTKDRRAFLQAPSIEKMANIIMAYSMDEE